MELDMIIIYKTLKEITKHEMFEDNLTYQDAKMTHIAYITTSKTIKGRVAAYHKRSLHGKILATYMLKK